MDLTNRSFHLNWKPHAFSPKNIYKVRRFISCCPPPRTPRAEYPQIGWDNRRKNTCSVDNVHLPANIFQPSKIPSYIWKPIFLGLAQFWNILILMIFLSRMVRLCKVDDKNRHDNINSCYCAASLITSKHALTAFHCVDGDMESETYTEKSCELRDLSKRENHFCF